MSYSWPGNIRELRNIIERAAVVSEDGVIDARHVPQVAGEMKQDVEISRSNKIVLDDEIKRFEKKMIVAALKETGGVQSTASNLLGITQRSLWHRVKKHGIDPKLFKSIII